MIRLFASSAILFSLGIEIVIIVRLSNPKDFSSSGAAFRVGVSWILWGIPEGAALNGHTGWEL